jgi:hypothetical protein
MKPTLTHITISGTMQGEAWGGFTAQTEFSMDFLMPPAPSMRAARYNAMVWDGIREALLEVTSWGDVIGGMGEITSAQVTFQYAGGGVRVAITRELIATRNTKDFFAEEGEA